MATKTEPKDKDTAAAPATDPKRTALEQTLNALDPLDRNGRLDVLRAAAAYHGLQLGIEDRH